MLTPDQSKILTLLCTCQTDNIALAEALAKGLNINIVELLEQEDFFELGIKIVADFEPNLLKGNFLTRGITNLSAIKYFPNLTDLDCSFNQLTNLYGIEDLPQLKKLSCYCNELSNIETLEKCAQLEVLDILDNLITSLAVLKKCPKLVILNCSYNRFGDFSDLKFLTQLTHLTCSNARLTNLFGLENLVRLEELDCSDNHEICDLSPLFELPNLRFLNVNNNYMLFETEIARFRQHQPNCEIIC
jgi:Leucine-rich repeat (LRR) protein